MKAVILWVNGWSMPDELWEPMIRALPDMVHRKPNYAGITHPEQFLRAVREELTASCFSRPLIVIGWSMGGMLAQRIASETAVDGLIVISSTARFVRGRAEQHLGWQEGHLNRMKRMLEQGRENVMQEFGQSLFTANEQEFIAKQGISIADSWPLSALTAGLAYLQKEDCRPLLSGISCPVTVIHGTQDTVCPYEAGVELSAGLSSYRFIPLKDCGHAVPLLYPAIIIEEVKRLVREYVQRDDDQAFQ
ncbi:alpha/beta hydrolase [Brevibacillus ruminantium]|uniref:Alpha/beta hydrolase n=1 Tax=Brevibacillus ruminantium TaxID=2950604 RepID=A0ABY4WHB3_9BACL|nr:alpha/beta hydrolase [Brevibacillus ruminantium]USG65417.1 alpha/beta hydrolase [Brevibacillus ruminantium]